MYVYLFCDRKLPCKDAALILHSLLALCVARFKSCIVVCLVRVVLADVMCVQGRRYCCVRVPRRNSTRSSFMSHCLWRSVDLSFVIAGRGPAYSGPQR